MKKTARQQFCTFRIARRLFGVEITDVKEIHPPVKFMPVFHATEEVKGFVNIRGQIHLVIDLRILLGFESKEISELSQILLFKPHVGESFGVLVDSIGDVAEVDETQVEGLGKTDQKVEDKTIQSFSDLVKGVCKLKQDLLVVLNSSVLLKRIEENQLQRSTKTTFSHGAKT